MVGTGPRLIGWCWAVVLLAGSMACSQAPRLEAYDAFYSFDGDTLGITTMVDGLQVPWEIVTGPDGDLWFTEQHGLVTRFDLQTGTRRVLLRLEDTQVLRTSGLLGLVIHPDIDRDPYVYLAYTARTDSATIVSRIMRYTYDQLSDSLVSPLVICEFGAWTSHFGARLQIAPDGKLMVTSGDGAQDGFAQDTSVLQGKVLRFDLDGSVPMDNPNPGSPVWAWGLRNPQGLAYASTGMLYGSDHGDAMDDEVNLLEKGKNYGWSDVEGYIDTDAERDFAKRAAVTEPLRAWTPTVAPAALAVYEGRRIPAFRQSLLLATLKGNALHLLKLADSGRRVVADSLLFHQVFGRLRAVCVAENGDVYFGTSNRDWNPGGKPQPNDDRIIRIRKVGSREVGKQPVLPAVVPEVKTTVASRAATLYANYCAACHQPDGKGMGDTFPALTESAVVRDPNPSALTTLVLEGRKEMPAFHFLPDEDLAEILTYIRGSFGGVDHVVDAAAIARQRNKR